MMPLVFQKGGSKCGVIIRLEVKIRDGKILDILCIKIRIIFYFLEKIAKKYIDTPLPEFNKIVDELPERNDLYIIQDLF